METIVDTESGEIIDLEPQEDSLAGLVAMALEAQEQSKRWDARAKALKHLIGDRMGDEPRVVEQSGLARRVVQHRKRANGDTLRRVLSGFELTAAEREAMLDCVSALEPTRLTSMVDENRLPRGLVMSLIEDYTVSYIQVSPVLVHIPDEA